jgi:hypothetical protein
VWQQESEAGAALWRGAVGIASEIGVVAACAWCGELVWGAAVAALPWQLSSPAAGFSWAARVDKPARASLRVVSLMRGFPLQRGLLSA